MNLLEEVVLAARERGYTSIALTDVNNLYGCVKFWDLAKRADLTPILGAEIVHPTGACVLLVRSKRGYSRLCEILTAVHRHTDYDVAHALAEDRSGLFVLTGDERVLRALRAHMDASDVYGVVTPGPRRRWLRTLGSLGIQPVATTETTFLDPDDHTVHRVIRAIDLNHSLSRLPASEIAPSTAWLMPPGAVVKEFRDAPEALANTVRIAQKCVLDSPPWGGTVFPSYDGLSEADTFALLERRCNEALPEKYPGRPPEVVARLRRELHIIREKGFAGYFLVVRDIVRQASRSCGRGSGAASLVSYLLDITALDPIRHNLMFERFLNPSRKDPPDIDVDFAWDERDDVLDYVFKKYGLGHAAMVANHVTFQPRMAVREVARVYGLPDDEIGRVTERLGGAFEHTSRPSKAVRGNAFRDLDFEAPWPEILNIADKLIALPRHLSVHPGGVILTPGRINRHVPIQTATKGVPIIHWEKDQAEDAGLVKIDLLGNRSLAVIRDAIRMVKENHGLEVDFSLANPIDDPGAQELMRTGRTMGCFYVESPAMRLLLKRCGKPDYDHLVIASSIIRPAANPYIMEYIARVRGERPATPIHALLEPVLADSYQIAVYQEHIMLTAMHFAGFDIADADGLRKALGKKDYYARLGKFKERFYNGARSKGVEDETIGRVWAMMMSFSGYSFCKPHSASYAMVSYQSAYLKAHYPAEHAAAVISNQGGYYSWWAYHNEAIRSGLKVLPPSINLSDWKWTGRDRTLRMGLMQVKGLNAEAAEVLLQDRKKGGPYGSLREFMDRVESDPSQTILLIKAGAFDNVSANLTRAQMIWYVLRERGVSLRRNGSLFETPTCLPVLDAYDEATLLRHEAEVLGFLVSRHPLSLCRRELERIRPIPASDLEKYAGKDVTLVGWWVTSKMAETKKGEPMEFVSFEDTTALFDATLFPKVYARAVSYLHRSVPYVLRGRVEEQYGACTVTVKSIAPLDPTRDRSEHRRLSLRRPPPAPAPL